MAEKKSLNDESLGNEHWDFMEKNYAFVTLPLKDPGYFEVYFLEK
jgi:hypothetical protein